MPRTKTIQRARQDAREGKSPSTQAGEFVREEIHRIRVGKHGARSPEQAIAIGLSMARRAGINLPLPVRARVSKETRHKAEQDLARGRRHEKPSPKRSRARLQAMRREPTSTVSHQALSEHAKKAARLRLA